MTKLILTASALALAIPAVAQTTAPAASTGTAASATVGPANAGTATSSTMTAPDTDGTATTTAAPAPAQPQTAEQILAAEFPTYDKDANQQLSKAEFDAWMTVLQSKNEQKLTSVQLTSWLGTSFTKADADKSKTVSLAELNSFLTSQQG